METQRRVGLPDEGDASPQLDSSLDNTQNPAMTHPSLGFLILRNKKSPTTFPQPTIDFNVFLR